MPKLDVISLTDNESSLILFNTSCFHLFKYIKQFLIVIFYIQNPFPWTTKGFSELFPNSPQSPHFEPRAGHGLPVKSQLDQASWLLRSVASILFHLLLSTGWWLQLYLMDLGPIKHDWTVSSLKLSAGLAKDPRLQKLILHLKPWLEVQRKMIWKGFYWIYYQVKFEGSWLSLDCFTPPK